MAFVSTTISTGHDDWYITTAISHLTFRPFALLSADIADDIVVSRIPFISRHYGVNSVIDIVLVIRLPALPLADSLSVAVVVKAPNLTVYVTLVVIPGI